MYKLAYMYKLEFYYTDAFLCVCGWELLAAVYSTWLKISSFHFSISSSIALKDCGVKDSPCMLNFTGPCPQIFQTGVLHLC